MKKWTLALILAAGCGGEEPPLPPKPAAGPPPIPAPRMSPVAGTPSVPPEPAAGPPPTPAPTPPMSPVAATPSPYVSVPPRLRLRQEGQIHLAAFKLRSVSGKKADLFINGEATSTLPALWAVTSGMEFDPKIPVDAWPPEGARYAGKTTNLEDPPLGSAEVYVASGKAIEALYPHLQKGEHVVYVRARFPTGLRQGAVRLWTGAEAPLRYTGYSPFAAAESDEESRLLRTIWFDDPLDE